jgi:hypothetical protein
MQGGSRVDFVAMAVRQGILASDLPINCSGFSEVSAFRPWRVPGPTSKLSPRAPAQMGRRETECVGVSRPGGPWADE